MNRLADLDKVKKLSEEHIDHVPFGVVDNCLSSIIVKLGINASSSLEQWLVERKVKGFASISCTKDTLQTWMECMRPWSNEQMKFDVFNPKLCSVDLILQEKMKTFMNKVAYVLLVPILGKGAAGLPQLRLVSECVLDEINAALTNEDTLSDPLLASYLSLKDMLEPSLAVQSSSIQEKVDNMAGIKVLHKKLGSCGTTLQAVVGSTMKLSGYWAEKIEHAVKMEGDYLRAAATIQHDQSLLSDVSEESLAVRAKTLAGVCQNLTSLLMILNPEEINVWQNEVHEEMDSLLTVIEENIKAKALTESGVHEVLLQCLRECQYAFPNEPKIIDVESRVLQCSTANQVDLNKARLKQACEVFNKADFTNDIAIGAPTDAFTKALDVLEGMEAVPADDPIYEYVESALTCCLDMAGMRTSQGAGPSTTSGTS